MKRSFKRGKQLIAKLSGEFSQQQTTQNNDGRLGVFFWGGGSKDYPDRVRFRFGYKMNERTVKLIGSGKQV